jgi:hypothetical protein
LFLIYRPEHSKAIVEAMDKQGQSLAVNAFCLNILIEALSDISRPRNRPLTEITSQPGCIK